MSTSQRRSVTHEVVFSERLRLAHLLPILRERPKRVVCLDSPGLSGRLAAVVLRLAGASVELADFFTGDLRDATGQSVYFTALHAAERLVVHASSELVGRQPALQALDRQGRPGMMRMRLEKWLLGPAIVFATRIEVARILEKKAPGALIIIELPPALPASSADLLAPELRVLAVGSWSKKCAVAGKAILLELREVISSLTSASTTRDWKSEPTILTVREDDIGTDPTVRGQLHWLSRDATTPTCRTVILPRRGPFSDTASTSWRAQHRVLVLTHRDVAHCLRRARHPLHGTLSRHAFACWTSALRAGLSVDTMALLTGWALVRNARRIAAMIESSGARVWVSSEPYAAEVEAVHLVADALGVQTVLFQYSSFASRTLFMSGATDVVATFGAAYAALFPPPPTGPRRIVPLGYLYGDVARHVAVRAAAARASLEQAGARFVLCVFDENVQYSHWGLISPAHHREEFRVLAQAVLSDPTFGVLVKTKYSRNTPERVYGDDPVIRSAMQTGRMKSLATGGHRNQVFPTEAALAADLCIGHSFGSTASLEAALAGVRSVLLRSYPTRFYLESVLKPHDLLFDSIEGVLEAMNSYRRDAASRPALGDWSAVLDGLDEGRDGRAPERLRTLLERAATGV